MTLSSRLYEALKQRLDDGDVGSPVEFTHVAQVRFLMSTIGAWPYEQFGRHRLGAIMSTYNRTLISIAIILTTSCVTYLRIHIEEISFFDMGHLVLCLLLTFLYLVHSQTHIISGMFGYYVCCEIAVGASFFTFMPLYNNYSRGMFSDDRPVNSTFKHAVSFYCFTDAVYTTTKGYWMLFAFNIPVAYTTAIGMCAFDLLVSLIVIQIWGHIKLLNYNLLHMPLPADTSAGGMFSAEENIYIRQLLKENVQHHQFIATFVDKCSNALGEYLLAFYGLMQLITCISLLELSALTADAIVQYGPLAVAMHQQLIQVSVLFEMLNTKSEQLIQSVYAVPWECMNASNRRTVLIFLHRVQKPVSVKAGKVVPVGVTTMFTVLKNTFSYFMLLKTVASER